MSRVALTTDEIAISRKRRRGRAKENIRERRDEATAPPCGGRGLRERGEEGSEAEEKGGGGGGGEKIASGRAIREARSGPGVSLHGDKPQLLFYTSLASLAEFFSCFFRPPPEAKGSSQKRRESV